MHNPTKHLHSTCRNRTSLSTLKSTALSTLPLCNCSLTNSSNAVHSFLITHNQGQGEWKKDSKQTVLLVYWKKPEDWAQLIHQYVLETGQTGSVLTVFELLHGDETADQGKTYKYRLEKQSFMKWTRMCSKKRSTRSLNLARLRLLWDRVRKTWASNSFDYIQKLKKYYYTKFKNHHTSSRIV